ncbi:MAG: hypothetical protein OK438_05070 [Thaumarchaeota archaeon]|nr:hypothetical protein [Nitrososphaerota archaeon]
MNPLPAILQLVSPNTGPSLENLVFDPTYYGLTALIIIVAVAAAVFGLRMRIKFTDHGLRTRATGTGLAAFGFAMIFVATTSFLALDRAALLGGFLYQQAQFVVVYVGAAMMLYGVTRTVFPEADAGLETQRADREKRFLAALWIAFVVSVVIALTYLFNPSTYTVTVSGGTQRVAQEGIFYLPPFVIFVAGAVGLPVFALRHRDSSIRRHAIWFGLFFVLELFGVLRESTLIPSAGDPFVDLLVAFIPFTAGGFCLFASALSLRPTGLPPSNQVAAGSGLA